MAETWHGVQVAEAVPDFGLRLDSALLVPEFVSQLLESGHVVDQEKDAQWFSLLPLDELKAWLRPRAGRGGEGLEELAALLLGEEQEAREQARVDGEAFDLVEHELEQMEGDDSYELFDPPRLQRLLSLVLEEVDEVAPAVEGETGMPFYLSVGFLLPQPHRNPLLKEADIAEWVSRFAPSGKAGALLKRLKEGRVDSQALNAALNLEFARRGSESPLKRDAETGVVRVPLADPRAGDDYALQVSIRYPLEYEGYFLRALDAIAAQMALKSKK